MEYNILLSNVSMFGIQAVMSTYHEHAERIYAGNKLYELRKVIPRALPRKVYLYETSGPKAITGHMIIERVMCGSPDSIWSDIGVKATSKERFFAYFNGCQNAYAYEISDSVKYKEPVTLQHLRNFEPSFRPPQNFLYVNNLPKMQRLLTEKSMNEVLTVCQDSIELTILKDENVELFRSLVVEHIEGAYLETGIGYADKLLSLHYSGSDMEGIFTRSKVIYEVSCEGALVGFVVVTEKAGGCVKTGPVMLLESYRNQGVGSSLRRLLHDIFLKHGYRKIYCTVPSNNNAAVNYLLKSNYKLEAHLKKQYHLDHDEFVFGYMLQKYRAPGKEFVRPNEILTHFSEVESSRSELVSFIVEEFTSSYSQVSYEWAAFQISEALAATEGKGSTFKKRRMYVGVGLCLKVVALCLIKRGGGVKIVILSQTSYQRGLSEFIGYVERCIATTYEGIRKFYTHVPLNDVDVAQAFYDYGYSPEGVLERPYSDTSDLLVLAKSVE